MNLTFDESPTFAAQPRCESHVDDMRSFNRSYMAFLISVGLLGNILTIVVFMASKLRHVPSSHYLTALATADAGVLTCRFLASIQMAHPRLLVGTCQSLMYANNVFACLSVWFVVAFTIERFVAVWYPLARLRWCTVRRTRFIIFGVTMLAVVFYLYFFILIRVQRLRPMVGGGTGQTSVDSSDYGDMDLDMGFSNSTGAVAIVGETDLRPAVQLESAGAGIATVRIQNSTDRGDPTEANSENETICDVLPGYVQLALTLNYADSFLTLILPLFLIIGFNASIACRLLWPKDGRRRTVGRQDREATAVASGTSEMAEGLVVVVAHFDGGNPHSTGHGAPGDQTDHVWTRGSHGSHTDKPNGTAAICGHPLDPPKPLKSSGKNPLNSSLSAPVLPQPTSTSIDLRRHGGHAGKRVDEKVTRLLFIISTAFLIMNMPDHIVRMIIFALVESGRWKSMSTEARCRFEFSQQVTNTIFYTYFAVNFFLYNVAGVNFRRELRLLVRRCLAIVCETLSMSKRRPWKSESIETDFLTLSRPSSINSTTTKISEKSGRRIPLIQKFRRRQDMKLVNNESRSQDRNGILNSEILL